MLGRMAHDVYGRGQIITLFQGNCGLLTGIGNLRRDQLEIALCYFQHILNPD